MRRRVVQRVVIQFDLHRGGVAAIDDAGHLAGVTQAAARTRTLQVTLGSIDFDLPCYFSNNQKTTRDQADQTSDRVTVTE